MVYKINMKLQPNNIDFLALTKTRTYVTSVGCKVNYILSDLYYLKSRFSETQVAFSLQNQEMGGTKKAKELTNMVLKSLVCTRKPCSAILSWLIPQVIRLGLELILQLRS
jgi:hypothetical protein